jgi:hypothetical protein
MRSCPVCNGNTRRKIWTMDFKIPDGWPLPKSITWCECKFCGMIFGDGDFNQSTLDDYYKDYYGYGVDSPENITRLEGIAHWVFGKYASNSMVVDFGGGEGSFEKKLKQFGVEDVITVGVGDDLPGNVDVMLASHVLEHIYDLPEAMERITKSIKPGGVLIVDGPDTTGILQDWNMPIMDFNTKHINHFSLINYLDLGRNYGYTAIGVEHYRLQGAYSWRIEFLKGANLGSACMLKVESRLGDFFTSLKGWEGKPINIWGMGDITWHILSKMDLNVQNYIDNDPAYRGKTYNGKPVLERPDNDYPILILAQGQRERLVFNILSMGINNRIVEI